MPGISACRATRVRRKLLVLSRDPLASKNTLSYSSSAAEAPSEAKAIASDAYLYAYAMLYNYKTMFQQTADPSFPGYIGGFNR